MIKTYFDVGANNGSWGFERAAADFFHCDTQGHDLDVLKSFGNRVAIIKNGEIETAVSLDTSLYVEQYSTIEVCCDWLLSKNFIIQSVDIHWAMTLPPTKSIKKYYIMISYGVMPKI